MTIVGGYRKYEEISFLRGVSITTVILMHLIQVFVAEGNIPQWMRIASSLGGTGGHIFVFCSGFGLYLSYLEKPTGFRLFLKNRFIKIYIPYVVFILIEFFLPHTADRGILFRQLLSHVFLYKMFFEKYTISFGLQFWFISTILQLYLVFYPLCLFRKRFSRRALMLLGLALSIGWWILMGITGLGEKRIWGSFFLQYLWEFTFGMAAAEYLYSCSEVHMPVQILWITAIFGLLLQALMAMAGGWVSTFNDIPALFGYGSAALLLWNYGKRIARSLFLWLDGISYEWFLVHTSVFARFYGNVRQLLPHEGLLAVLALILSVAVAWIYAILMKRVLAALQRVL